MAKSLWASVQGNPKFMLRLNGWLTLFWVAMIPISYSLGWLNSVTYVSALQFGICPPRASSRRGCRLERVVDVFGPTRSRAS